AVRAPGQRRRSPVQRRARRARLHLGYLAGDLSAAMKYSVIVPIYNDAYLARAFCVELKRVFEELLPGTTLRDELELIFVNDGSVNDSLATLRALVDDFDFVLVV